MPAGLQLKLFKKFLLWKFSKYFVSAILTEWFSSSKTFNIFFSYIFILNLLAPIFNRK